MNKKQRILKEHPERLQKEVDRIYREYGWDAIHAGEVGVFMLAIKAVEVKLELEKNKV